MTRWNLLRYLLAVLIFIPLLPGPAQAQDTVQQWRRWEKTIVSNKDFTTGGGNPYRDLVLRVQFSRAGASSFTQDAFWEASAASPKNFKVRAALPPGTWTWQVVGCTGTTGTPPNNQDCAVGTTWTPSSGTINVTANTSSGVRLYDLGMPTQVAISDRRQPPSNVLWKPLTYGDLVTSFFFAADTAWAAPPREIAGQTNTWSSFLTDRKAKGFTSVLIAPAVGWVPGPSDPWPILPVPAGFSFTQTAGCLAPIPNECSKPLPAYWQAFDALIEQANLKDLYIGIVGLIHPVGLPEDAFPNLANVVDFSRYLAARLGGNHVFFSPGFDLSTEHRTFDTFNSLGEVMNASGAATKLAAPRHLVTNHLSGSSSTCDDYRSFASPSPSAWMTFYLFQSGHGSNVQPATTEACPGPLSTESELRAATRRARQMPLQLKAYTLPALPNFNGEGPYDASSYGPHEVDNRHRVRHAGHFTSLSDGMGYTYGNQKLIFWHSPTTTDFNLPSASDMSVLANRFRNRAGLPSRHAWLLNQVADPNHEQKMVLASDGSSQVLAYLSGAGAGDTQPLPGSIRISTADLTSLSCGNTWTRTWRSADTNVVFGGSVTCTAGTGFIEISRPACTLNQGANPKCDWVLEMQRTGAAMASPFVSTSAMPTAVWVETNSESALSQIRFSIENSVLGPTPQQAVVAETAGTFQASPRLAVLAGSYLVVWEEEFADGSLRGIFAQRISSAADKLGALVQVNTYTEHDQAEPAVANDAAGNVVVVWSSYGQDGDLGGIFARRFSASMLAQGAEFQVNQEVAGHQEKPQIILDSVGNWVIAWTTRQDENTPAKVSWRKLSSAGVPLAQEFEVATAGEPHETVDLIDLEAKALGGFHIRWSQLDQGGNLVAIFEQTFDAAGGKVGPRVTRYP